MTVVFISNMAPNLAVLNAWSRLVEDHIESGSVASFAANE